MNPIDRLFDRLRSQGRKAFIPFLPAGDPDLVATECLLQELTNRGADLIELGFPYSDPIADGPVIQASYTRALARGVRIDDILSCVRQMDLRVPVIGMVSYTLVHRRGPERFVDECQAAGFSGLIVPDLPVDEADSLGKLAAACDFKLAHLVTPATPKARAVRIARQSTGFLYCVSITGITGERDRLPEELVEQLHWLRSETQLPLCVGFGISKPEHIRMLRDAADGVIVGSALVRFLDQIGPRPLPEVAQAMGEFAAALVDALRNEP